MGFYLTKSVTRGPVVPHDIRSLLKRERVRRGWTYDDVGRQIGIGPSVVRAMENGTGTARHRYETLQLWAGLFDYEIGISITKRD